MQISTDSPETDSPGSQASKQAWETAKAEAVAKSRKTPFDLRRQVCLSNDAKLKLTTFAKLLFCRLTDMCFEFAFKRGEGIVECSKKFLADDFTCSVDTITRATRLLESAGFVFTKTIWTGAYELTWWFVREWADDKQEFPRHSGANVGRRQRGVQRNVTRNSRGVFVGNPDSMRSKFRAFLAATNGQGASMKARISPDHGKDSAPTGTASQPRQGRKVSPDHGQDSALTGPTNQPGQGAAVSPDRADESARSRPTNQPGQGAALPGLTTLQTITGEGEGELSKRSTGKLNAQGAGRGPRKASRENTFLLDVEAMIERWGGKKAALTEMSGSGVWWRFAYRKTPDLAERVLADTLCAVKERRINTTPGQHAVDLWKRWGGGSVKAVGK